MHPARLRTIQEYPWNAETPRDAAGGMQPLAPAWNAQGHAKNVAHRVRVRVRKKARSENGEAARGGNLAGSR